ncbi:MAG: hypothetical protein OEX12_06175 [Gammaproteobacteria bacterium]|nr:hypothetical protein [Gammaproteobacteria bacterium]
MDDNEFGTAVEITLKNVELDGNTNVAASIIYLITQMTEQYALKMPVRGNIYAALTKPVQALLDDFDPTRIMLATVIAAGRAYAVKGAFTHKAIRRVLDEGLISDQLVEQVQKADKGLVWQAEEHTP